MPRILPVTYEMNYIFTKTVGYHLLGQNLICRTDTREEAIEHDKNAIGVFKSGDQETLVGHLPIEISCLLTNFLKAAPENKLDAIAVGKRKREVGLIVPAKYVPLTKNKTFANILFNKLQKKKKHPNFELDVITTTVTNVTKCKIINTI